VFPTIGAEAIKENQETYFASFAQLEERLGAVEGSWIHQIRRQAIARFGELGFPTTHQEEWKYTNVAPLVRIPFQPATEQANGLSAEALALSPLAALSLARLVFVNGVYSHEFSSTAGLPEGVQLASLAEALAGEAGRSGELEQHLARYAAYDRQPFVALNTAFLEQGAFLRIPPGLVLEQPIHLLFVSTGDEVPRVSHPRSLILADRESQVALIESYVGLGEAAYFTNAVTEIAVGESAVVEHYKLQQESRRAFHMATMQVHLERSSVFSNQNVSLGGALVRNDLTAVLDGEGAECTLNGLYLGTGRQHVDNHTTLDHARPHCSSHEIYRGILDGKASGVFNGGIIVRQDAQKTNAKQSNRNLLLSQDAVINTKPQLEIWADDVRCTHGATVGQIDQEALFYLRTRGMDLQAARDMLTYAFASEPLGQMKVQAVRRWVEGELFAQLAEGRRS
jgi:Fe-S cluster assembly protein SufD